MKERTTLRNLRQFRYRRRWFPGLAPLILSGPGLFLLPLLPLPKGVAMVLRLILLAAFLCGAAFVLHHFYRDIVLTDLQLSRLGRDIPGVQKAVDPDSFGRTLQRSIAYFGESMEQEYTREILQKQALLHSLQSQINPHFLYNTLDCIRGKALDENCRETADMIGALSAFFRYTISSSSETVTLEQELRNVDNFVKIQNYRFPNRFVLIRELLPQDTDYLSYRLPKLSLQPLVENAIQHGLRDMPSGGVIRIRLRTAGRRLILAVEDNGKGIADEELLRLNLSLCDGPQRRDPKASPGSGIALQNVNARIRLMYGEDYGLSVYSILGHQTRVELALPLTENAHES